MNTKESFPVRTETTCQTLNRDDKDDDEDVKRDSCQTDRGEEKQVVKERERERERFLL